MPLTYKRVSTKDLFSQPLVFAHNGREWKSTTDLFSQLLEWAHNGRESSLPLAYRKLNSFFPSVDANIFLICRYLLKIVQFILVVKSAIFFANSNLTEDINLKVSFFFLDQHSEFKTFPFSLVPLNPPQKSKKTHQEVLLACFESLWALFFIIWDWARGRGSGDRWLQWSQCGSGYVGDFLVSDLESWGFESFLRRCPKKVFFFFLGRRRWNLKEHGEINISERSRSFTLS